MSNSLGRKCGSSRAMNIQNPGDDHGDAHGGQGGQQPHPDEPAGHVARRTSIVASGPSRASSGFTATNPPHRSKVSPQAALTFGRVSTQRMTIG